MLNQNAVCGGSPVILGCTNESACNYNAIANQEDNSCLFMGDPCDDGDYYSGDDDNAPKWYDPSYDVLMIVMMTIPIYDDGDDMGSVS